MSEITALSVHFIQVKNNFIYLHSKLLQKYKNLKNETGCVEIKFNNTRKFGSCYSTHFNSNGENAFNISSTYAKTLDLKEFDIVIISNAENIKPLKNVFVTPVSKDDWDIIECSAEIVQSSLLNQIRVICVHQTLPIWISKSFSLKVHIDVLDNGMTCGKLEQYTEVVVSTDIKICQNCQTENISLENQDKIDVDFKSTWNFLKDMFSYSTPVKDLNIGSEKDIEAVELVTIGIFRCLPYKSNVLNFAPKLYNFPYNVFVDKKYFRHIPNLKQNDAYILCKLTHLPLISSKKNRKRESVDLSDGVHIVTGQSNHEICVHLYVVCETDIVDCMSYSLLNCYPSIFVSKAVQSFLNMKTNSKVKLDVIQSGKNKEKLTEINFSVLKSVDNLIEEDISSELQNYFCSYIKLYDKLIVNNYCIFTLNNEADDMLYLTFNPANLSYVELCLEDLNHCDFRFVKREVNVNWDDTKKVTLNSNFVPLSFLQVIKQKLKISLLLKLKILRSYVRSDMENNNYVVLEGDIGTGKSTIINMLCEELPISSFGIYIKKVECKSLKGKLIPKLKKIFEASLNECVHYQPAVLCLDDLDIIFTSSKQNNQQQSEPTVTSYSNRLSNMIYDLIRSYSKYHITVLATALNVFNFEPCLYQARGAALFTSSIRIPVFDQEMRKESFTQLLGNKSNLIISDSVSTKEYLQHITERTEGYCIQDMSDLVDRIYFEALKRQTTPAGISRILEVQEKDIDKSVSSIIPLSLKGIDFHKNSDVCWKNVGGLETAKQLLMEVLIWPSRYPKIFDQCPLKMQSGVLLYGVPGSGKTLLASAVAGESGLNFISIKGPELLSKFVGESEEGIRNTFRKAQNAKPCILFFDEFDSLAPRRGNDITGVTDRVVNQLLTELDGVESVSGVWVLAATSRPDLIDPALLRPGRLGTMIYCPLPSKVERSSILKVMASSMELSDDIDFNAVAQVTEGYTGADLRAVLYTAYVNEDKKALLDIKSGLKVQSGTEKLHVDTKNSNKIDTEGLIKAVQEMKPSLKPEERFVYEKIYERFIQKEGTIELDQQRLTYA